MSKDKKPTDTSTTKKKAAAKKSPSKKAVAKKPVSGEIAAAAATSAPSVAASSERSAQPSATWLHEEIRQRAYELFCERGRHHGHHEADWHRAESEVRSKHKA
jgi:hypothetical protein